MSLGGVLKVFGRSKKDIGDRFKACKKLSIRVTYFIRIDGSKILKSDHKTIVFFKKYENTHKYFHIVLKKNEFIHI